MLIGSIGLNRTTQICMTVFVSVSISVYIVLALTAAQMSLRTTKSTDLPRCISDTGQIRTLDPAEKMAGDSLPLSRGQNASNIDENIEYALNNKNTFVIPDGAPYNSSTKKKQNWNRYVFKPNSGVKLPPPSKRKRILTRSGYFEILSVNDRTPLKANEVAEVAKYFMYDKFTEDSKSSKILTFKDRSQKYTNFENPDSLKPMEKPLCPIIPPDLIGKYKQKPDDFNQPSFEEIANANPKLTLGGKYTPPCHPRSKIAIIIPFRGRETQLRTLLAHMHPIWQRQQIDYSVYVISQEENNNTFNKAKLMNAGFLEANKHDTYDCFVFHDVDLLLEDDRCLYTCPDSDNARIIAERMDKFNYKELKYMLPCKPKEFPDDLAAIYFGGVAMMTAKQFFAINGYSNLFWGWGSEDIDIFLRLWQRGYDIVQPYSKMCSYHMIKHEHEESNKENEGRFALLANSIARMKYDGLTSIRYKILSVEQSLLFTNITLSVGVPQEPLVAFMNRNFTSFEEKCGAKLPWQIT